MKIKFLKLHSTNDSLKCFGQQNTLLIDILRVRSKILENSIKSCPKWDYFSNIISVPFLFWTAMKAEFIIETSAMAEIIQT